MVTQAREEVGLKYFQVRALTKNTLSVCLSVRHKSTPADRILIKFNFEKFYEILNSDFGFG
jgi:hypothetical protein